jgi:hypothetical protein
LHRTTPVHSLLDVIDSSVDVFIEDVDRSGDGVDASFKTLGDDVERRRVSSNTRLSSSFISPIPLGA